jgi:hypothetical protein
MSFKTTGVLLAVIIVIGAVWLFYPRSRQEEPAPAPSVVDTAKPLFDPQPDSRKIVRVAVERPGKPALVFTRSAKADQPDQMENWQAEEPLAVPIQTWMVDGLVSTFAGLTSQARYELGKSGSPSLEEAGLSPPAAVVTLTDRDGKQYRIEVGKKAAISADTYIRIAGESAIHVTPRDLLPQVRKEFKEYRDKKLTSLLPANAVSLVIQLEGRTYRFTRGEAESWTIDEPIKAHGEKEEILALLRKVTALRAQDFIDDQAADLTVYGLDAPYLTLTLETETRKQVSGPKGESETQPAEPQYETVREGFRLAVGGFADMKQESRFARLDDQSWVFSLLSKDVEGLRPDLNKLRDPRITRVKAADAEKLTLSAEGLTVSIFKQDDVWQGSGDLAELEPAAVSDVLEAFEDLRALDYVTEPGDLRTYGLDEPRAIVSVLAHGAVEPVTVRVGAPTASGRNAYVMRDGHPTVYVVSAAQADRLAIKPLSLRSRKLLDVEEKLIRGLQVQRGPVHYQLVREGEEWKLLEPAGAPLEIVAAKAIVADLARLRAKRVVARDDHVRYGLDAPAVTIRFTVEAPTTQEASQAAEFPPGQAPTEHVLRVAQRDGVAYARLDDQPFVCELDNTVYQVLSGELIDRRMFSFNADDIVGLTIVTAGGSLEFVRQDGTWKFAPEPFTRLAQQKLNDLARDIAGLRVHSYEQYRGGDLAATGLLAAATTVSIRLKNGELANLKLADPRPDEPGRLAGWVEQKCIARLTPGDCDKLLRNLDYYLESETTDKSATSGGAAKP